MLWWLTCLVFSVIFCRSLFVLLSFYSWPLHSMSVFDIGVLITSLWYFLPIVLHVRLWYPASDYPFGIFWPLHCMSVFDIRLLITPLVSFGHCIACPSLISAFWLPLWYLLAIVLHVCLWYPPSDYPFGIFWPLYCMSVFDIRLLITPLESFGHCIACPSSISGFWLPLWYLQTFLILKGYKCTNMKLLWSNIYIKKKVKHPHVSLKWQMIRQQSRDYWPYNFKNAKVTC